MTVNMYIRISKKTVTIYAASVIANIKSADYKNLNYDFIDNGKRQNKSII